MSRPSCSMASPPIRWKDAVVPFRVRHTGRCGSALGAARVRPRSSRWLSTSLLRNRIGPRTSAASCIGWRTCAGPSRSMHALVGWEATRRRGVSGPRTSMLCVSRRCVLRSGGGSTRRASTKTRDSRGSALTVHLRRAGGPARRGGSGGPLAAQLGQSETGTPGLRYYTHTASASDTSRVAGRGVAGLRRARASARKPASLDDDFEARYTGTISRSSSGGGPRDVGEFDTTLDSPSSSVLLVIVLRGTDRGDGLVVQRGTATISSAGRAKRCSSVTITSIEGGRQHSSPSPILPKGLSRFVPRRLAVRRSPPRLDNATQRDQRGRHRQPNAEGAMMLRSRDCVIDRSPRR